MCEHSDFLAISPIEQDCGFNGDGRRLCDRHPHGGDGRSNKAVTAHSKALAHNTPAGTVRRPPVAGHIPELLPLDCHTGHTRRQIRQSRIPCKSPPRLQLGPQTVKSFSKDPPRPFGLYKSVFYFCFNCPFYSQNGRLSRPP